VCGVRDRDCSGSFLLLLRLVRGLRVVGGFLLVEG
jgi:hypothetical protein